MRCQRSPRSSADERVERGGHGHPGDRSPAAGQLGSLLLAGPPDHRDKREQGNGCLDQRKASVHCGRCGAGPTISAGARKGRTVAGEYPPCCATRAHTPGYVPAPRPPLPSFGLEPDPNSARGPCPRGRGRGRCPCPGRCRRSPRSARAASRRRRRRRRRRSWWSARRRRARTCARARTAATRSAAPGTSGRTTRTSASPSATSPSGASAAGRRSACPTTGTRATTPRTADPSAGTARSSGYRPSSARRRRSPRSREEARQALRPLSLARHVPGREPPRDRVAQRPAAGLTQRRLLPVRARAPRPAPRSQHAGGARLDLAQQGRT